MFLYRPVAKAPGTGGSEDKFCRHISLIKIHKNGTFADALLNLLNICRQIRGD